MNSEQNKNQFPPHTSTFAFETYVPTVPVLSSRETGWEGLTVRSYREPPAIDDLFIPTAPDIFLVLVMAGTLHVEIKQIDGPWVAYHIQGGDWFLTPGGGSPYIIRWRSLSPDPIRTLHLHLDKHLFSRIASQVADQDSDRMLVQNRSGFQDAMLAHLGHALLQELQQPAPAGKLYAETVAQMIAVHLLRNYMNTDVSVQNYTQNLSRQQIRRVAEFIHAHLNQDLSLDLLAQQAGFSAYHFARLFRQTTGESPHQFVLRKRIEMAEHLLKGTDMPLVQVAQVVGFHSQSHFTQSFKQHLGLTPGRYRQNSLPFVRKLSSS